MKKPKTNRQVVNQAIKNLNDMELVIFRERVLAVMEHVIENEENIRIDMANNFISPDLFIDSCKKIFKEFDFTE